MFPNLFRKVVVADFDATQGSSDGGALLLKAADDRLCLTTRLASALRDERDPVRVRHEIGELVRQRVFSIACGHPDANDAARLSDDPVHKLLVGRDPVDGDALASQPTLSRFENGVSTQELYRMGEGLAEVVIERHRKRLHGRARRITIDLDPTDDPTHGQQQLSFFNGHYDTWCYLPVVAFATFNDEREQYLLAAVLRPGNAPAKLGAIGILARLLERLRDAFPKARFRVRLDGGFACPEILDFLDAQPHMEYAVAMAKNLTLEWKADRFMRRARKLSCESEKTEHIYGECRYRAKTWKQERRGIIKAEVARHPGLEIDRTSCSRFWANQLRVLLTAAAYVLMQELRLRAARTTCARAQVWTLRDRLVKIGAHVVVSVRRVVLHLPSSCPDRDTWSRIAFSFGAAAG